MSSASWRLFGIAHLHHGSRAVFWLQPVTTRMFSVSG
jgi:hypothetical protein